jgi:glycosyltransferase involved in cell wall biosynthesis
MISAVVITKNEEQFIKGCLESIKWADEIIVYDNGSTDKTLEIAKKYTQKIYKYEGRDYSELRNKCVEKCTGDWILYVDADERVLEPLKEELLELEKQSEFSAYAVSRINVIFGEKVEFGHFSPDFVVRFLKRESFKSWRGKIHEYPTYEGKLGYTKNSFLHLTHRSLDQLIVKNLHWSNFDAKLRFDANHPKMSSWRFLRIFIT